MGIQISLPMMAFLVFMTGFAGFVDSAAGGGGLISLPAYLFAGLPPHYTYATNKFSAACGTTFATASFFKNGAMNIKVGILAAIGSFAGSALGAHIVLMLSDEVLQMMMFIILPIAAVIILWRRNLPDENRDDGTLNLKKALLALGIGLQNLPEGMAVSLPLRREGYAPRQAFFYGQLSGVVEPIAAVLGALLVLKIQVCLPFLLAFAAGAMIYVVVEELIPEASLGEHSHTGTLSVMLGFLVFSGRILSLALVGMQQFPFLLVAVFHFVGGSAQALILTPITLMIGRSFSREVSSTAQTLKTVASKGIGSSTGAFLYGWLYSQLPARGVMLLFTCLIFGFGILSRLGGMWVDARTKAAAAQQGV